MKSIADIDGRTVLVGDCVEYVGTSFPYLVGKLGSVTVAWTDGNGVCSAIVRFQGREYDMPGTSLRFIAR